MIKNLPAKTGDMRDVGSNPRSPILQSLDLEDLLEEGTATYSRILA